MRKIHYIVVHCSATREGCALTPRALEAAHRRRGFRTPQQRAILRQLVHHLLERFGTDARLCGHRDLSPDQNGNERIEPREWLKACPCFDVAGEL